MCISDELTSTNKDILMESEKTMKQLANASDYVKAKDIGCPTVFY